MTLATASTTVQSQLLSLKQDQDARILLLGDSTSDANASGLAYIPRLVYKLADHFGGGYLAGASTFAIGTAFAVDDVWTSRQVGALWRPPFNAIYTTTDGGSPSNTDIPLGGRSITLNANNDVIRGYGVVDHDWPTGWVTPGADSDVPAALNGTRLIEAASLAGKSLKVTLYAKSNTAGADNWRLELRGKNDGSSNAIASGTQTTSALTATTGDAVKLEHTFNIGGSVTTFDDGFVVRQQAFSGTDPLTIYGWEWEVVGDPGIQFVSWSRGSQAVRDIEDESGGSDGVLAAWAPDIVLIRFGPNESGGSYAADLGDAMDWVHAAVPGALVGVITAPFTPFNSPYDSGDSRIAEMETHSAAMDAAVAARSDWAFGLDGYAYHAQVSGISEAVAESSGGTGLDGLFVASDGTTFDGVHYKYGEGADDGATLIGEGDAELLRLATTAGGTKLRGRANLKGLRGRPKLARVGR